MKTVYPWQNSQWQSLSSLMQNQCLPHALLFHGESDIGKFHCAQVLGQTILCSAQTGDLACGFCKQCQLSEAGFHPDLMMLEPEGASNTIKIDVVRGLIHFLSMTSQQGGWKVAIINQAEKMNPNAANALLKSLEEPAPSTLLILVSGDSSRLIATVKSRCRQIPFPMPATDQVLPWLSEVVSSKDKASQLLESASGKPLWAKQISQEGLLDKRFELEQQWQAVATGEVSPLVAATACDQLDSGLVLDWFYYYVGSQIKSSEADNLKRRQFRFIDRLSEARQLLNGSSNPNKQLLWEELMLDWKAYS